MKRKGQLGGGPLFSALLILRATLSAAADQPSAQLLTFPVEKLLPSRAEFQKTIEAIASVTRPNVRNIRAGTDLVAVIRNEYGDAAPLMWPFILKANSSSEETRSVLGSASAMPDTLVVSTMLENFVLPVGPRWHLQPSVISASKSDTLNSLAERYLGATRGTLPQARAELQKLNPGTDFSTLHAGDAIEIPQISYPRIVRASGRVDEIKAVPGAFVAGDVENLRPVTAVTSNCRAEGVTWPVNWAAVLQVLDRNQTRHADRMRREKTVVAVMDTGVAPDEDQAQRISFWHGANHEIGYDETRREANGHPPTPWQNFQDALYRDHGTLVAGLIQGGDIDLPIRTVLRRFSDVMMLKVVGGGPNSAVVPAEAIDGAINDGVDSHASVFNISIAPSAFQSAWNVLRGHVGTLFVVAAGNGRPVDDGGTEGYLLDHEELEPAELGGSRSPNVVSVAAHSSDGALPRFSNRGRETVTLAAPGCVIRSYVPTAERTGALNGTSFAAPLVSAAAAILSSYQLTARQIKERLIASVEWRPELDDVLFSGGVFSFEKALDVYSDIVLSKPLREGGAVKRGVLITNKLDGDRRYALTVQSERPVHEFDVDFGSMLKMTVIGKAQDGAPRIRMVWVVPGQAHTVHSEVVRLKSVLSFRAEGEQEPHPLEMNVDLDIVPGQLVESADRVASIVGDAPSQRHAYAVSESDSAIALTANTRLDSSRHARGAQ